MTDKDEKNEDEMTVEPETDFENAKDPAEIARNLKEKLKGCQRERQEYLDALQRMRADFVNVQKREKDERSEFIRFSTEGIIREILPSLSSFHSAFGNKAAWEKVDLNWRMGVQYIYSQLLGVLEKNGVTLIEPRVGEKFDPVRHASVESVPVQSKDEDHSVCEVLQRGFALHGRIVEPAKVRVGEYREETNNRSPTTE